jgi:tRNA pseudouridine32 synthase / 23S rRNA pseudouridine746 synthase
MDNLEPAAPSGVPATPGFDPAWLVHAAADLLVLAKPAGLLCQPGLGPELADALITRVQRQWPSAQLVHRLDRDTSGLLLVALSPELHRALSILFARRKVFKRYEAVVHGCPSQVAGRIKLALVKRQNRPPLYGPDPAGKPCRTDWRLLDQLSNRATSPHEPTSRLALIPHTGRSHQLRVHLSAIGHPIVGDPLYGPQQRPAMRLHLHASQLRFRHPLDGRPLAFHAPCPF